MFRRLKELFGRIDNHIDMLDALTEKVENAINAVRKHYGY